ncbi:glycosyltransferase [Hippea jasoniae]|uniref:glycosyltransferase n=1 Tax=Hippea jasoniae TaxID=944479 RepID=UPI0005555112|nr:glycosyltransferase [Hippea jasoniae]
MKIAFVLDEIWDSALTSYSLRIAQNLKKHTAVLVGVENSYVAKKFKHIHTIKALRNKNPFKTFSGFNSLKETLKNINPEVVVTIRGDATLLACLLKKTLNFQVYRIFGEQKTLKTPAGCIDKLILPCNYLKSFILRAIAEKTVVFQHFYNPVFFYSQEGGKKAKERLGLDGYFVFGAVGRFDRVKGFDMLIRAFAKADIHNAFLVIIGREEGIKTTQLKAIAKQNNIEDRIIIIDTKRTDINEIVNGFDVGVISSIDSEVIPRVFFEFLQTAKPIITTDVGCLKEVAKPSFSIVVPPDENSLADAIKRMALKANELKEMSTAAINESNQYRLDVDSLFN